MLTEIGGKIIKHYKQNTVQKFTYMCEEVVKTYPQWLFSSGRWHRGVW